MAHRYFTKAWYNLACWRKRRAYQLRLEPCCRMCAARGITRAASIADHIHPHSGSWKEFRMGEIQSLCAECHRSAKRIEEVRGYSTEVGPDGLPVDRRHPYWTGRMPEPPPMAELAPTNAKKPVEIFF